MNTSPTAFWRAGLLAAGLLAASQASALVTMTINEVSATTLELELNGIVDGAVPTTGGSNLLRIWDTTRSDWVTSWGTMTTSGTASFSGVNTAVGTHSNWSDHLSIATNSGANIQAVEFTNYRIRFTGGNFNLSPGTILTLQKGFDRSPSLIQSTATVPVPEPSTYALIFGAGALGFVMIRRRRK